MAEGAEARLAGDGDWLTDEGHAARHVRSASPGTVDVWVVPGAGHTGGLDTAPDEWERRVTAFLSGALGDDRTTG